MFLVASGAGTDLLIVVQAPAVLPAEAAAAELAYGDARPAAGPKAPFVFAGGDHSLVLQA